MRVRCTAVTLAVAAVLTAGFLTAPTATAHDTVLETKPAQGAVLTQSPTEIRVRFNAKLLPMEPAMVVTKDGGGPLRPVIPIIEGDTLRSVVPPIPGPGKYQVGWSVVASDGHPIEGTFTYTVTGAGESPTSGSPQPTETKAPDAQQTPANEQPANSRTTLVSLLFLGLLLVLAAISVVRRQRIGTRTSSRK